MICKESELSILGQALAYGSSSGCSGEQLALRTAQLRVGERCDLSRHSGLLSTCSLLGFCPKWPMPYAPTCQTPTQTQALHGLSCCVQMLFNYGDRGVFYACSALLCVSLALSAWCSAGWSWDFFLSNWEILVLRYWYVCVLHLVYSPCEINCRIIIVSCYQTV